MYDPTGKWKISHLSSPNSHLGQSPLRSPSVFNFYEPDYLLPNSDLDVFGATTPELQITNETTVAGYANFIYAKINSGFSAAKPDYSSKLELANDPDALVTNLDLLLTANQLSAEGKSIIVDAISQMRANTTDQLEKRVKAAILMIMLSPDYLVLE